MATLNPGSYKPAFRAKNIRSILSHLERTTWGKGGVIQSTHGEDRIVAVFPAARPAQLRAGARKLYDQLSAKIRREKKLAVHP